MLLKVSIEKFADWESIARQDGTDALDALGMVVYGQGWSTHQPWDAKDERSGVDYARREYLSEKRDDLRKGFFRLWWKLDNENQKEFGVRLNRWHATRYGKSSGRKARLK